MKFHSPAALHVKVVSPDARYPSVQTNTAVVITPFVVIDIFPFKGLERGAHFTEMFISFMEYMYYKAFYK